VRNKSRERDAIATFENGLQHSCCTGHFLILDGLQRGPVRDVTGK
jgi:hypothetical protein